MLNGLGQEVARQSASLPAAGTELAFDVAGLASGIYTLRLLAGSELVTRRLTVQ